jgi:hypothetical protein
MAELADAADSKSSGRPNRQLAKCSFFFVFQHIEEREQNQTCGSVRPWIVLFWSDGYSLATVGDATFEAEAKVSAPSGYLRHRILM